MLKSTALKAMNHSYIPKMYLRAQMLQCVLCVQVLSGSCFLPLSKTMITSLPGLYNFPLDMKQWMDVQLYPKKKPTLFYLN